MITIMKWNDVEMIDGEFYFVDVKRWRDNEPNEWVFVYRENMDYVTEYTTIVMEMGLKRDMSFVEDNGFQVVKLKEYKTNQHVFIKRQ